MAHHAHRGPDENGDEVLPRRVAGDASSFRAVTLPVKHRTFHVKPSTLAVEQTRSSARVC